jgi:hypothetical protein
LFDVIILNVVVFSTHLQLISSKLMNWIIKMMKQETPTSNTFIISLLLNSTKRFCEFYRLNFA